MDKEPGGVDYMQGKLRDEPSRRSREWGAVDRDIMWYTRSILVGWLGGGGKGAGEWEARHPAGFTIPFPVARHNKAVNPSHTLPNHTSSPLHTYFQTMPPPPILPSSFTPSHNNFP